jgi:isoamylase
MNTYCDGLEFEIPQICGARRWHVFANTGATSPEDCFEPGKEPPLSNPRSLWVGGRSVVILVSRPV